MMFLFLMMSTLRQTFGTLEQYRPVITYWSISMSDKYPFIPDHLERGIEDISIPLIDLMHGHLKIEMLACEEKLERTTSTDEHEWLDGYMAALTDMYCLTYNLSIDRKNIEEKYYA
jgi:hypothetical protein